MTSGTDFPDWKNDKEIIESVILPLVINNDVLSVNNSTTSSVGVVQSNDNYQSTASHTDATTSNYVQQYVANAIISGKSFRGGYDASSGNYPSVGGSGPGGVPEAGDYWIVITAGSVGLILVIVGDTLTALITDPGQISTNWFIGNDEVGITSLTGDVTGTGPGATATTLATVNANTGSFGSSTAIPSFTVNGKGLITAASTNVVIAPAGTLSGTTLNSTVVTSSLTSVGTIATGVWNGTAINLTSYASGTLQAEQFPALTGDVTTTAGALATTLATNIVTYSKFQKVAASSLVGNSTGILANAQEITLGSSLSFVSTVLNTIQNITTSSIPTFSSIILSTTPTINYVWTCTNTSTGAGSWKISPSAAAITSLTGDVTGTGPGATATTLATVNANTGSFGSSTAIPSFTVNGKGLITAASTNVVIAPAGTLTGTTLASNVVTSSLTSVGTIATGTWQAGIIGTSYGGLGVNASTTNATVYGFNVQNSLNINGSVALQSSAYPGIFPSFAFISIASQNLLNFGVTQNVLFSNYGYVKNNQSNITVPANITYSFTLGIGIFYVEANLYATGGSTGWAKFQITNGSGTLIGSSNKAGFVQTTGASGQASDWTASAPATSIINVTSGTTQVFINIFQIASGYYIVLSAPDSSSGSFVKVTQIG